MGEHGQAQERQPRPPRPHSITPAPPLLPWTAQVAALKGLRSALALELWRTLRRVHTWADTPSQHRAELFALDQRRVRDGLGRACAYAPQLIETFAGFARLVTAPGEATPDSVARACHEVMRWAAEEGRAEVAVLFAEAAAAAEPDNAEHANLAARASRTASLGSRAATWYNRGFGLAVRTKHRQAVIDALLGHGNLLRDLGRHQEARPYFERAARRAVNTGRLRQAGKAHHDLLTIAAEVGTLAEGHRHVRRALDYYPAADPRLPALTHDWAYLLVRLQHYSAAVPLLSLARRHAPSVDEELMVTATLAWASGALRNRRRFDEAEAAVTKLLGSHRFFAAAAYVHLARGAWGVGLWDRAESYAREAQKIARTRSEAGNARAATELLARLRAREPAPVDTDPPDPERIASTTRRLLACLREATPPGRPRPGAGLPEETDRAPPTET